MCKKYYFCPEFLNTKANFMNKKTLLAALLLAASTQALAGDYLTNTNHSASFLRMPAQEGYISIEGAYYNPAGIGFLPTGWHFALNNQTAFQTRTPRLWVAQPINIKAQQWHPSFPRSTWPM